MKRKTLLQPFIVHNNRIKDFFRIMRISLFLLFVCVCQLMAEEAGAQNIEIKISQNSMTVKQLVKEIEAQTDYLVVFRDQDVDVNKTVSFRKKSAKISDYLEQVAESTGIGYRFDHDYITLVSKKMYINQDKKMISGRIVDSAGEPIIGANLVEKGTANGSITDVDGNFSIQVSDKAVLVVSYIGYLSQEIKIKDQRPIRVVLIEDTQALEEVVVIGYGTAKRRDLTGAIASVKAEKMEAEAPRDITDLMRGTAAGLNVGMSTSAKGDLTPQVRGVNTLTAGSSPTIVVDGVIYYGSLSDINTNDVASIDVLKDASSAAVYGSQAANGVIVITTKKGKGKEDGSASVTFNANVGFVQSANQMPILDGKGYLKYRQDYNIGNSSSDYLAQYPEIYTNPFELDGTGVNPLDWYNYNQKTPVSSVSDEELTRAWLS